MPMDSFSSEGILRRLIRLPYLPLYVGVLNAAVELDVFSDLTQRKSVRELSEERGWNEDNTRYFLDALYCLGFIWKRDGMYCNCRETDRYLVKRQTGIHRRTSGFSLRRGLYGMQGY